MTERDELAQALRAFLRPTLRGKMRRFWRWLNPLPVSFPTDGFRIGDFVWINEDQIKVVSKMGRTLQLENGTTVTM